MKTYSFFTNMVDRMWDKYNRNSLGYMRDPIAVVYPRIYLGSMCSITPEVISLQREFNPRSAITSTQVF